MNPSFFSGARFRIALMLWLVAFGSNGLSRDTHTEPVMGNLGAGHFLDPITRKPISLGPIDPAHVIGFELLYATPGSDDMAEIAGHLLLRIKLLHQVADDATENPYDMVVSFLADTLPRSFGKQGECPDPLAIAQVKTRFDPVAETWQALKGLSGGLGTEINRATLSSTIYNYTVFQDRNLLRYELILTELQKVALLRRLELAMIEPGPDYYFFNRNCASILARVVAEGIGEETLASFDEWVLPPHTLVAMFVRQGVAPPRQDAFFSYRRQGLAAEKLLDDPGYSEFQTSEDLVAAVDAKAAVALTAPIDMRRRLYRWAELLQYAEMSRYKTDSDCLVLSSPVVIAARRLQKSLLAHDDLADLVGDQPPAKSAITALLARDEFAKLTGNDHTKLLWSEWGVLATPHSNVAKSGLFWGGALFRQDLGDSSRFAMQRAAEVHLAEVHLAASERSWESISFKLLDVSKLRENLADVPSIFVDPTHWGLNLKLLHFSENHMTAERYLNLGGLGALANLWSSPYYNDFLLLGVGLYGTKKWSPLPDQIGHALQGELQIWLTSLITLDTARRVQLRGQYSQHFTRAGHGLTEDDTYLRLCRDFDAGDANLVGFLHLSPTWEERNKHRGRIALGVEWHPY